MQNLSITVSNYKSISESILPAATTASLNNSSKIVIYYDGLTLYYSSGNGLYFTNLVYEQSKVISQYNIN